MSSLEFAVASGQIASGKTRLIAALLWAAVTGRDHEMLVVHCTRAVDVVNTDEASSHRARLQVSERQSPASFSLMVYPYAEAATMLGVNMQMASSPADSGRTEAEDWEEDRKIPRRVLFVVDEDPLLSVESCLLFTAMYTWAEKKTSADGGRVRILDVVTDGGLRIYESMATLHGTPCRTFGVGQQLARDGFTWVNLDEDEEDQAYSVLLKSIREAREGTHTAVFIYTDDDDDDYDLDPADFEQGVALAYRLAELGVGKICDLLADTNCSRPKDRCFTSRLSLSGTAPSVASTTCTSSLQLRGTYKRTRERRIWALDARGSMPGTANYRSPGCTEAPTRRASGHTATVRGAILL